MGITIHYRFMVRDKDAVLRVLKAVREIATKIKMKIIEDTETCLTIHPHPNCETLCLDFKKWKEVKEAKERDYCREAMRDFEGVIKDENFVCSSFTKTQYAGCRTHILVAEILRNVAARCTLAYVGDEAGYYETGDFQKTEANFDASSRMIRDMADKLKEAFGSENVYCAIDNT